MSLELKPEKVKIYLKLLTEACIACNSNKGSLRKDLWAYLREKYDESVDYRDFLFAIKRFQQEGKILSSEGIFEMHHEVLVEVREKTPTPALKPKQSEGRASDNNVYLKFLSGQLDDSSSSKKKGKYPLDSKISDSGKKQKVKPHRVSPSQRGIQKYFIKKQMNSLQNIEDFDTDAMQTKTLGFATPAFDSKIMHVENVNNEKETPKKTSKDNISKRMSNLQKQKNYQTKNEIRKKQLEQQLQQVTKKIQKNKKFTNEKDHSSRKNEKPHHDKKQHKQNQDQAQKVNLQLNQKEQLDQLLLLETEKLKKKQRDERDERKRQLKEKKDQVMNEQRQKLTSSVIKALKKAIQCKNIRLRKYENTNHKQSEKIKKTKSIKKVDALKVKQSKAHKKSRALNQLKNENKAPKLMTNRLRGKTLDLTELGIIKKKKDITLSRQSTLRLDKSVERDELPSRQLSRRSSVNRQLSKTKAIKKDKKQEKQVKAKLQERKVKQPKLAKLKKAYVKKAKKQQDVRGIVDFDRKAKLDAVKNLRQLYSKDKLKDALYIDEKLIYL